MEHIATEGELDRWRRLKELRNTRGVTDVQDAAKQGKKAGQGVKTAPHRREEPSTGRERGEEPQLTDSEASHG